MNVEANQEKFRLTDEFFFSVSAVSISLIVLRFLWPQIKNLGIEFRKSD